MVVPSNLPQGTALRGPNAVAWASAILQGIKAKSTEKNIDYLCGWFLREGGGGKNNPLNTTLRTSSSAGSINNSGVQNYSSPAGGVLATVSTLSEYPAIVSSFRDGHGLQNAGPGRAIGAELLKWSGGGYSEVTPISIAVVNMQGTARFSGSIDLPTGKWTIQGEPGSGNVQWGMEAKEFAAEIELSVGPGGGKWRIKGEPANAKPLGK